jgi:hypothetical protein
MLYCLPFKDALFSKLSLEKVVSVMLLLDGLSLMLSLLKRLNGTIFEVINKTVILRKGQPILNRFFVKTEWSDILLALFNYDSQYTFQNELNPHSSV